MEYTITYRSPLGEILLASDGEAVTGLWFEGQKHYAASLSPEREERETPVLARARRWLDAYFRGEDPGGPPPLSPRGTAFQKAVWDILLTIPRGEVRTYAAVARDLAARRGLPSLSAQAVGSAVGRNPISLLIPCHRVVGSDGSLTGYAAGLDKKLRLLALEGADTKKLHFP